jgi:hypothetical protein
MTQANFGQGFINVVKLSDDKGKHTGNVEAIDLVKKELPYSREPNQQQFFHYWNMAGVDVQAGDEIEYFFEVWDNDGINGPKSSRSKIQVFKAPSLDDLEKTRDESNEKIKDESNKRKLHYDKLLDEEFNQETREFIDNNINKN